MDSDLWTLTVFRDPAGLRDPEQHQPDSGTTSIRMRLYRSRTLFRLPRGHVLTGASGHQCTRRVQGEGAEGQKELQGLDRISTSTEV